MQVKRERERENSRWVDRTEVAGEVDGHVQGSLAEVLGCGLARCKLGSSVEGMENAGAMAAAQGGSGVARAATALRGRQRRCEGGSGDRGEVFGAVASSGGGRRSGSGGGTKACGGGDTEAFGRGGGGDGGNGGWTPSLGFCEQPLEMEETPFFSQMTARFCGGSLPLL